MFRSDAITCVYGPPGIGKTHFVTKSLPGHVLVDYDILKSRQGTLDFFERLHGTRAPIIIDNWESISDLIGIREIVGPVSLAPFVIIAHKPVELTPTTIMYPMPIMPPEKIVELAPNNHPAARELAEACRGDIRSFLRSLVHKSDAPDIFETPRDFVDRLLSSQTPVKFISHTIHEHGYVWGMIEENYTDTSRITLEECANLTESLSYADIYDTKIYNDGSWDTLMPYFTLVACFIPCYIMDGRLSTKRLRAGSMWTKYQNACMRAKKIALTRMTRDALITLRAYVEQEQYDLFNDYKHLDASIVDVLNHIMINKKLKSKSVERAKAHLRKRS